MNCSEKLTKYHLFYLFEGPLSFQELANQNYVTFLNLALNINTQGGEVG